ncbi:perlucin-like protein [Argopecten irradians]|uniref:perlucin-like protein n=1 Tax=Argopecten irradians TaxID=31199 RepID=UPI00371DBA17
MLTTMSWSGLLALQVLLATPFVEAQFSLTCPTGYQMKDTYCYKTAYTPLNWYKASEACQSEGSQLVWIVDWDENEYVKTLLSAAPQNMYWTGLKKQGSNWRWEGNSEDYNLYYGFWEDMQPDEVSINATCVAGVVNGDWTVAPTCDRNWLPFICKTMAYPQTSFKCSRGPAISARHTCDGFNDCEDGSDEVNCNINPYCNWY